MSSSFKATSRLNNSYAFRNRTNAPAPNRYSLNYSKVDKDTHQSDFGKTSPRPILHHYSPQEEYPNVISEVNWFNQQKQSLIHATTDLLTSTTRELLIKHTSLGNIKQKYIKYDEESPNHYKRHMMKTSTFKVSSYGFNYWDTHKLPVQSDVYWPPLPQKKYRDNTPNILLNKQTGKSYLYQRAKDVNEKRFGNNNTYKNEFINSKYRKTIVANVKCDTNEKNYMVDYNIFPGRQTLYQNEYDSKKLKGDDIKMVENYVRYNSTSPNRYKSSIYLKYSKISSDGLDKVNLAKLNKVLNPDDNVDIIRDASSDNVEKMRQSLRFLRYNKPNLQIPDKVEPMPKIEYQKQFNDSVDNVIHTINKHLKEIDLQERGYDVIKEGHNNHSQDKTFKNHKNYKISNLSKGKIKLKSDYKLSNQYNQTNSYNTNRSIEK